MTVGLFVLAYVLLPHVVWPALLVAYLATLVVIWSVPLRGDRARGERKGGCASPKDLKRMAAEHGESPDRVHRASPDPSNRWSSGSGPGNVDTLFMSALLAVAVSRAVLIAARRVRSDRAPTGLTLFVEFIYDWVDEQVAEVYPGERRFMTALALTLFSWVVAMNVHGPAARGSAGPSRASWARSSGACCRPPTSTAPSPMAIVVLSLVIIFGVRAKGIGGYLHEWIAAPFGRSCCGCRTSS